MEALRDGDPARIGPYRLLMRLGAGAMGQVYLGEGADGRQVAVKLLNAAFAGSPEYRQRFAREVEAAKRVEGARTGHVVDADPGAERPWLATEHVPGPTLREAVAEHGAMPADRVAALGAGLAEGLAAIHGCGLVHRDLKPGNVIMAEDGPRIIDFGIARAVDASTLTGTGTVLGTYGYMAPEQITADLAEPSSDVFALGCVMAFAATGSGPFDASTVPAIIHRVISEPPRLDGVPDGLREVVGACLSKDPARRPTTGEVIGLLAAVGVPTEEPTKVDPHAGPGPYASSGPHADSGPHASPDPNAGGSPVFSPGHVGPSAQHIPQGETVAYGPPPAPKPRMGRRTLLIGGAAALGAAAVPLWFLLGPDGGPAEGGGAGGGRIGIALPSDTPPRWRSDGDHLKALFEAEGCDVDLQYAGYDPEVQVGQIKDMVDREIDALVVAVVDIQPLNGVLAWARESGVAVVAYDRLLFGAPEADYYTGFDQAKVGALQAAYIVEALGLDGQAGPFNLELFAGSPLDPTAEVFFDGAWEVLQPYVDDGRLVVRSDQRTLDQVAIIQWDADLARSRMDDLLEGFYQNGARVDAVLSPYDGISRGVIDSLQEHDYTDMPVVTGHDPDADSLPYFDDGLQAMTVLNDPETLAQATVDLVRTILDGEEPDGTAPYANGKGTVPAVLVDPVSINGDDYQEALIDSGYLD